MKLNPDFREFIELLNERGVEYLIVGGYAVGVHGYPRYTGDLDVWIASSSDNAVKMMETLTAFGFPTEEFDVASFEKDDAVVQIGYPPVRIDIMASVDGVSFSECYAARQVVPIEGLAINFISLPHLKQNKRATGRTQDLSDLEHLE